MDAELQTARDANYGDWCRCVLKSGRVVYIGGCGECGTPWFADDNEPPVIKDQWVAVEHA